MDTDPFGERDDTEVDVFIEVDVVSPPETTARYDTGEWLRGFDAGVIAGRADLAQAFERVLTAPSFMRDAIARARALLNR